MPIQEFELYHGAVLTKVMRTAPRPTLRLIEKDENDAWGSYQLNAAIILHIKHATAAKALKRTPGVRRWQFTFPATEAAALMRQASAYVALVCVGGDRATRGEICLLEPRDVRGLLDPTSDAAQTITVAFQPAKQLRARNKRHDCKVPRNRIDTWQVPGS